MDDRTWVAKTVSGKSIRKLKANSKKDMLSSWTRIERLARELDWREYKDAGLIGLGDWEYEMKDWRKWLMDWATVLIVVY